MFYKQLKLVRIFFVIFTSCVFLSLSYATAYAATYYVRADGTVTSANKANATSPNNASTSLNMAQAKLATFAAGDEILFSSQGGNFTEVLILPSGGSGVGSEVTYANVPSETPVIAIASGLLIDTNTQSNIIIRGLTANYTGSTDSSNMGVIVKAGSNIQFIDFASDMNGHGYNIWSSAALSNVMFDNVTLAGSGNTRNGIRLSGASNNTITVQNSNITFAPSYASSIAILNFTNVTITNTTTASFIELITGTNATVTNLPSTGGITLTDVTTATLDHVTGTSGPGFLFNGASTDITVNDSSMNESTSYGGFETAGTTHHVTYNRCTSNYGVGHGFVQRGTSNNITCNNCKADYNGAIGFLASISASDITYRYSEASYNGAINVVYDGGGFLPHDNTTNIRCYYCIANHNFNEGIGDVGDGANNSYYNVINWMNGYALGDTYRGSTVTTPSARSNIYYRKAGGDFVVNNGIFGGGKPREIFNTGPAYTTLDYNMYQALDDSKFYSVDGGIHLTWAGYHALYEPHSTSDNPLFVNATGNYSTATDFQLTYLSPAIDTGLDVGLTVDYIGNPIYGTPDLGVYEYQPPHTVSTNAIDLGAGARIYADGKFRDLSTVSGTQIDLTITPQSGTFTTYGSTAVRPQWLDVTSITWSNTETHHKQWTESSTFSGQTNTVHTVGDLEANKNYLVSVDSTVGQNITGATCTSGVCVSNSQGEIAFAYTGTYAANHVFDVEEGDNVVPTITNTTATPTVDAVTITWTTNENASTKVDFGLTTSYANPTTETNTSPRVQSHSVTISSLVACTTYHYRVRSIDSYTNEGIDSDRTFTTTGCTGSASVLTQSAASITTASGGSLNLLNNTLGVQLTIPSGFAAANAEFQAKQLELSSVTGTTSIPTTYYAIGTYMYDLKALSGVGSSTTTFDQPITVQIQYGSADVIGRNESSLYIYRWDGANWNALSDCAVNLSNKTVTCTTTQFSVFGLFGQVAATTQNNSNSNSNNSSSNNSNSSPAAAPMCNEFIPDGAPDLFQINAKKTSVTLYFAPAPRPYTKYYVQYSRKQDVWEYGVEYDQEHSDGVLTYTINMLSPNTTYYFRVRAGNGCMPGTYGNTMSVKTTSNTQTRNYYKNIRTAIVETTKAIVNTISPKKTKSADLILPVETIIPTYTPIPTPLPTFVPITPTPANIKIPPPSQTPVNMNTVPEPQKKKFCILWICF